MNYDKDIQPFLMLFTIDFTVVSNLKMALVDRARLWDEIKTKK